ncbi:DNA mismatch repair endonuclease MutL [Selenomonas sp. oral taxon 136]|uniref:DNA mismatch repair endonuclease MutL n=1 Tax=Selenomonas sp. oral taxon 136 TaxID=713030 RepID=UPI000768180E|nr:DNA mismatch repair endonuclease MutL [Selenomonas sp. oral taxon 136]AME04045.1 DNA mismatch repair protein MutL [Selenomonas sp. oral taxon 136]
MTRIHVLDDATINKIAAGEVVERPASVVKELVENAMDAGATAVEVEIMGGGTSFIRVTDNGRGMTGEDARAAILRHATSKIAAASDLETIATLGFRGEALPTIASVSHFSLLTRQAADDLGTRVDISGGGTPMIEDAGCAVGTSVRVEDLFFNTPARKKFLKTNATEAGKISDYVIRLALSRPDIAFRFINNNRMTIMTAGDGDLARTIGSIYGGDAASALIPLDFYDDAADIRITGYISKPSLIRSSRAWQTYIVNGRTIQNRAIAKAIDNVYRSLVPKMGFPLAVIVITVPQRTIDVNVHPQKTEMKFEDEGRIFKAVYKAVLDAIRGAAGETTGIAAAVEKPKFHYEAVPLDVSTPSASPVSAPARGYAAPTPHPQTVHEAVQWAGARVDLRTAQDAVQEARAQERAAFSDVPSAPRAAQGDDISMEERMLPIGQVDLTYIIAQSTATLYIIDQHAAHERILFDRFSAQTDGIPSQQMLVHAILSFDAHEAQYIEENAELFDRLGFHLEAAGERTYRLTETPTDVPTEEAEGIICEILASLGDLHAATPANLREAGIATMACRAAIKAGEELSIRQMEILLEELRATPFPFTCPHGRPTILKFGTHDLAKMFKRTGFGL